MNVFLAGFSNERRGSAAMEFALAFPVVIGLTMGIVEIGHIAFAESTLEGAVREASRRGTTGFAPDQSDPGSRESYVRGRIEEMMDGFGLEGPVEIEAIVYDSFGDIGEPEPFADEPPLNGSYDAGECFDDINQNGVWDSDMGQAGLGGSGSVVVYRARVQLRLLTPAFRFFTANEAGTIALDAATAVRNEPFNLVQQRLRDDAPTVCT